MISIKNIKDSQFIQSILYLVCEYLDELNLNDQDRFELCKTLSTNNTLNHQVSENIRLQILNIIFKSYLKNQDHDTYNYS